MVCRNALALAVALALVACKSSSSKKPEPEPEPKPAPAPDAAAKPKHPNPVPLASRQLVLAKSRSWNDPTVQLIRYDREGEESDWDQVGEPIEATLGHKGMGWGIGLHGKHAPPGLQGPIKVEGDGRSPAGLFHLGAAFGYAAEPPKGTAIEYVQVTDKWRCVDDPESPFYNLVLSAVGVKRDWKSAERMRRTDELYRWGVLVDHNAIDLSGERTRRVVPAGGSCIFLHVWGAPGGKTVGCAAMARGDLEELIAWLRPRHEPIIALLPEPQFKKLKDRWKLP